MKNIYTSILAISFVIFLQQNSHAQATRTWVSGVGDDVNPCSRTAPCKTFAGAISKTADGGEISALDPGGYGAVTITKSITLSGDGTLAGILNSLTNGITVNAASDDIIVIRNISINGSNGVNPGTNGIRFLAGGQLHVKDCTISGFSTRGIDVSKTAAGILTVENTTINGNLGSTGIYITTTTDTLKATLKNVQINGISVGIDVDTKAVANIIDSNISQNINGVRSKNTGIINIENSLISNNINGVLAKDAASLIRLSNTRIFNNTNGVSGLGKVISFGNNKIAGNTNNGTITVLSEQ